MKRSSPEAFRALQQQIRELTQNTPYPTAEILETLDDRFIAENLSPGGSADLLAASFFLLFLSDLTKAG
jgi:holo-ACP synthase/triphosphoribosyl-dephospho-CoA synthase